MNSQSNPRPEVETTADREIVESKVVEAPARLVFTAWTDAEHLTRWWGPNGFTTTSHSFEFRPGGVWEFTMHGPDGSDYPNWVEWLEITPPERLVLRHGAKANDPDAFLSTVDFDEEDNATRVTMRAIFNTKTQRDQAVKEYGAVEGAEQTLGRMVAYVTDLVVGGGAS